MWCIFTGAWEFSPKLKEANVALLSRDLCNSERYYNKSVTENMFCAAVPDWSRDSCHVSVYVVEVGDSVHMRVCVCE